MSRSRIQLYTDAGEALRLASLIAEPGRRELLFGLLREAHDETAPAAIDPRPELPDLVPAPPFTSQR